MKAKSILNSTEDIQSDFLPDFFIVDKPDCNGSQGHVRFNRLTIAQFRDKGQMDMGEEP